MQRIRVTLLLSAMLAGLPVLGCGKSGTGTATDAAAKLDLPNSTGGVAGSGGAASGGAPGGGAGGGPLTLGAGGSTTTSRGGSSGAGGLTGTGGAATSTGGAIRSGGAGGTAANAGGSGGGGMGGGGGATVTLDGGVSACQVIDGLDRSCTVDADCISVLHTSNCCGQLRYIGVRSTESATFAANEPRCRSSYPMCGCGIVPPMMDDGSMDRRQPAQVGVTCLAGTCTTFMLDCGKPCPSHTTCFSCSNNAQPYAACSTQCLNPSSSSSSECPNPALPVCQSGSAGSLNSTFCTAAGIVCSAP